MSEDSKYPVIRVFDFRLAFGIGYESVEGNNFVSTLLGVESSISVVDLPAEIAQELRAGIECVLLRSYPTKTSVKFDGVDDE